ncbi:MAG TPA: hypothetical protein VH280_21030 [Verrucomicrobiae bacterium]|jgi:hypothetical protein|nr:hypothetical protein [Verrucomicrobiae bacterium]
MKSRTAFGIPLSLAILSLSLLKAAAASDPIATIQITAGTLSIDLDPTGNIIAANVNGRDWPLTGATELEGCQILGEINGKKYGKGFKFTRTVTDGNGRTAVVIDQFTPTKDSVRWEVEIRSDNAPWSTAIDTSLKYAATAQTRFWTAWSDPGHSTNGWHDPLVMEPFTNSHWTYSFPSGYTPALQATYICMPLVTFAEPNQDSGMSLVLSPEDLNLDTRLSTTADGTMKFSRLKLRLGGGRTVRLAMDLTAHEADWRGGLRWMVARYPQYFNPPNPHADEMAGCGAYSGDEDPIDVAKFKKMAFRINWKLSDDFPYMGMFIPPVKNADERWERSCAERAPADKPKTISCRQMNDYARYMRTNGFYVLNYFNVTEFGKNMAGPPTRKPGDPELWKDPRAYLPIKFPKAIYLPGAATCYKASVVDVGDPAYQKHILEQAARHNRLIPDSAGICIDRLDWLTRFNPRADDGVSWVNGKPARALFISWQNLLKKLGPLMHRDDKVIFVNPINERIDSMQYVDGVYNEMGVYDASINGSALMCLRKPVLEWTVGRNLHEPDADAFMQRHLLLGAYPTAPYPWNNHCLKPEEHDDQVFFDYGPLLDAMRGKKWVLTPHCVETSTPGVKVNLFQVPGGYALPVTFGGANQSAVVQVRGLPHPQNVQCEALQPGKDTAVPVEFHIKDDVLEMNVPLVRGCAMVRLQASDVEALKR